MKKHIDVNIWDEYTSDNSTYAYVEVEEELISSEDEKLILDQVNMIIEQLPFNLKTNVIFHDYRDDSPHLVGTQFEFTLAKRWELKLEPVSYEVIEKLLESLNMAKLIFNEYLLNFISES